MKDAKDCTCNAEGCRRKAVSFWPAFDPDIKGYPWCREHLDKEKLELIIKLTEELACA